MNLLPNDKIGDKPEHLLEFEINGDHIRHKDHENLHGNKEDIGGELRNNNEKIVEYILSLRQHRDELIYIIDKQYKERKKLETEMERITYKLCLYCCATVVGGVKMSWGGDNEPAAQAVLMSIGALGVDENKKHAKVLFDCISKSLAVPVDRMYIHFMDATTSEVGFNGTTFHEIFGR
ncbi:macrophage migration inhibitory factor-like isoform X1 [Diabrotica undecimpunctata]|uniref:macrophage migration inhibitory factor-like isoform X1 n=1 Tax=Diabrotica undecimpunctata TaxID=50387 RepID=UPI003B63675F